MLFVEKIRLLLDMNILKLDNFFVLKEQFAMIDLEKEYGRCCWLPWCDPWKQLVKINVHPTLIEAVVNLYEDDKRRLSKLSEERPILVEGLFERMQTFSDVF